MEALWQPILVAAVALLIFTQRIDRVVAGYLIISVNLEAFRFAGDENRITWEAIWSLLLTVRIVASTALDRELRQSWRRSRWLMLGLACFAAAAIVSSAFSMDPLRSWKASARLLSYLPLIAGISHALEMRGARWLTRVILAGCLVPIFTAGLQLANPRLNVGDREWRPEIIAIDTEHADTGLPRVNGTINNALSLAELLAIAIGWGAVGAWAWQRWPLYLPVLELAGAAAVLLTFSRGVWLCSATAALVWVITNLPRRTVFVVVLAGVFAVSCVAVYTGIFEARFKDVTTSENSLTWRALVWAGILDRPLTIRTALVGNGFNTMVVDNTAQEGFKAHNVYLAAYHDCGFPGVAAAFLVLAFPMRSMHRALRKHWANPRARAVISFGYLLLLSMAALSLTEEPLTVPAVAAYFWAVLLVCEKTVRELLPGMEGQGLGRANGSVRGTRSPEARY